jgi:hypothetical protein
MRLTGTPPLVKSASGYKLGKFRALQLLANSKIEAKSHEISKTIILLEACIFPISESPFTE